MNFFLYKWPYNTGNIGTLCIRNRPYNNLRRPGFNYLIITKVDGDMDDIAIGTLIKDQITALPIIVIYMFKLLTVKHGL